MTWIRIFEEQRIIDIDFLEAVLINLGMTEEKAKKLAMDIVSGYGFSMKVNGAEKAKKVVIALGSAGVRIKTAHETRNL